MTTESASTGEMSVVVDPTTTVSSPDVGHKLSISVTIENIGPCKRHVSVKVPRQDIDYYRNEAIKDLVHNAAVPGFRTGRVPRALIEKKFKKEVTDHIKQKLLVDSLEQLDNEHKLDAINEPDFSIDDLEIPDDGDFDYEFNVEVRPEFDLPNYKGLTFKRPVKTVTDEDINDYLQRWLVRFAEQVPVDRSPASGDFVEVDLFVKFGDETLLHREELNVRVLPVLAFQDAELQGFDELLAGAVPGDDRTGQAVVSLEVPQLELRGEKVDCTFTLKSVSESKLPELDEEFLKTNVGVETLDDLKEEIRKILERQVSYEQRESARSQVLEKITESANWDLPETLVRRQVENALRREILEMQQSGFTEEEITARENELRKNAVTVTRQALKEHFVLDKIATEEKLEVTPSDIETEIHMMAFREGESPRRIRAKLEKQGLLENLAAQILERKAIELVQQSATYEDEPLVLPDISNRSAVNIAISEHYSSANPAETEKPAETPAE